MSGQVRGRQERTWGYGSAWRWFLLAAGLYLAQAAAVPFTGSAGLEVLFLLLMFFALVMFVYRLCRDGR